MIVILADTHFGRIDPASERTKEIELISCLEEIRSTTTITELVLLGDIYDSYIEYRTMMPKGFSRFLGMVARWADDGVAIRYFAGNHDPWHIDFFATEFGATFFSDHEDREIDGRRFRFVHGDGIVPRGIYRKIKPILRHPVPVGLYRSLLPGDSGLSLARWVNEKFSTKTRKESTVIAIREYAAKLLQNGETDVFVTGHSHHRDHIVHPFGVYLNPGSWHYERTFALIDEGQIRLVQYVDGTIVDIAPTLA